MKFPEVELTTSRLLLRPWRLSDIEDAFSYASDPEWGRYLWNTPYPYTREHAAQFISRAVADSWRDQALWAIELDDRAVGGIRLYVMDDKAGVTGMGYNLAPQFWGRGLTTEAAQGVLEYAFEQVDLQKVCSTADARNGASIRVMQKLGMAWEGTFRRHRLHRGEYVDEVHYGVLRDDWAVASR